MLIPLQGVIVFKSCKLFYLVSLHHLFTVLHDSVHELAKVLFVADGSGEFRVSEEHVEVDIGGFHDFSVLTFDADFDGEEEGFFCDKGVEVEGGDGSTELFEVKLEGAYHATFL